MIPDIETLAANEPGGRGSNDLVPLCIPEIGGNEWSYVKDCLDTGWVSSVGSYVDRFEREIAATVGTRRAVATTSGTAALHVALQLVGVMPNEEVLVPALTFVAPANAVRYRGGYPVFIDAEPDHWQIDTLRVREFLERECSHRDGAVWNRRTGRRVRAVMPVHVLGHPCDMNSILQLAREYGLRVVEDATESLGALYAGRMTGALGDVGCLSFNGNKVITTGGGGMIVTNDDELADAARYLTTQAKDDPVEFFHSEVGYNYRLTNVQAAIGVAQLERLEEFVGRKRAIHERYREELEPAGFTFQAEAQLAFSIRWMSAIRVDPKRTGSDSRLLLARLAQSGIQSRPLWTPIPRLPPYRDCLTLGSDTAELLHSEVLMLPSSCGLSQDEQERVVQSILSVADGCQALLL